MRANEVFSWLGQAEQGELLREIVEQNPAVAAVALAAAAEAFRLRPQFLRRQPPEKRVEWVRRALSRPAAAATAEQVLAQYFLEARRELLVELLDLLKVPHEDGELTDLQPAPPEADALRKAVVKFRKGKDRPHRELLLRAFAAQAAVRWPDLDALVAPSGGA